MKITVELSDQEITDVLRLTGLKAKGPAIRSLLVDTLNLRKRREMDAKIAAGEWSVDFPGFEKLHAKKVSWE
jgi:Arc/MetJ family transcription regulator